ncbi:MAG TPA: serine hydrolase domain-containing protein, partial [Verrucomicrobiae bacterium]|nr:serine hydrolase domain-containing protein [Verrucomicrobiae bacterium]
MLRTTLALLIVATTLSACATSSRADSADAIVRDALAAGPYPGISVSIEQRGRIVYQRGFGFADLERQIPVTPETRFPVGSVTKTFTCLSVLQLNAAGAVSLDESVGHYLPDLPAPSRNVTVRALLNHSSGIPNYTALPDFPLSQSVGMSRADVVAYFADEPLLFTPGEMFNYSNSDTYLLGLVVESVSGETYDSYVQQHILTPFGMTHSAFDVHDDGAANRARGYLRGANGFERSPAYDFEIPFSAGALVSTTGDLLRYRRGLFGAATRADVRETALTQSPLADGTPNPYALGCLVESSMDGHRKISHAGDIFGFTANFSYYPDDDLTIVIATNNQNASFPPLSIERKLARLFLGLPAMEAIDAQVPADLGAALSGDYQIGAMRM